MHRWQLWKRTYRGELCNQVLPGRVKRQVESVEMGPRMVEEIPAAVT